MSEKLPTQAELNEQTAEEAYQRLLRGERVAMEDVRGGAMPILLDKLARDGATLHVNGAGNNIWYTRSLDPAVRNGDFGQPPAADPRELPRNASDLSRREIDAIMTDADLQKPPGYYKGMTVGSGEDDAEGTTMGARLARMREVDPSKVDAVMRKFVDDNQGDIHLANMTLDEIITHKEALIEQWKLEQDPGRMREIMQEHDSIDRRVAEGARVMREALAHGTDQFDREVRAKYPELTKPDNLRDPTELLSPPEGPAPGGAAPAPKP